MVAGPKKKDDEENAWRSQIELAPLDDDNWNVKVVMLESAGSEQDRMYLNKFETFASEEKRFVIKNICKTETVFMVNQLGSEKKLKDANLRVFEEGQAYLKEHQDIPTELLGLIIKYLILKMKDEYLFIKRQKLKVQLGICDEMDIMIDKPEVRNLAATKASKEGPPPDPLPTSKKDKGVKNLNERIANPELDVGKKYGTFLRERGEEWRDKVYVDDFPMDGPNLYVAITGFAEPQLAGCLLKIGVPLTAVVQIRIDPTRVEIPSPLTHTTKRGQSQTELQGEKALCFWDVLQRLRIDNDTSDQLKNTAFLIFRPPYWESQKLSGEDDKIYDEVCYLLYDIQDLYRQHSHYLEHMDVIDVPFQSENKLLQWHYEKKLCHIPYECVTIYSILDGILQTVCYEWDKDKKCSSYVSLNPLIKNILVGDEMEEKVDKAKNLVQEVFSTLCETNKDKKSYHITFGDEYELFKDPIIINYGNDAQIQTFHLGNLNLKNILWSSLYCMPTNLLWQNINRPVNEMESKINFHVNILLSCFKRKDVETAELNRLIHILAFRKLYNNRSSVKKQHLSASTIKEFKKKYLKRSILAEPLPACSSILHFSSTASSFPSITKRENNSSVSQSSNQEEYNINFLFDCPDLMELVSAAEIANNKPIRHIIDDFEYFEDLKGISSFQTILNAFNNYNCVDYKYCEVTDCLLMMFHSSHDDDGISHTEWRSHLSTPVCLQDFFDFVLEENYEWIIKEEKLYDAQIHLNSNSISKNVIDVSAVQCCVQNSDLGSELLLEGSLKYQELHNLGEAIDECIDSISTRPTSSTYMDTIESKSDRKTKKAETSPKKFKKVPSFTATTVYSEVSENLMKKPFLGYNLSDRRVEAFGKDSIFFSKDGTKVNTSYTLIIPNNLEYLSMCLTPGNDKSQFWFHKAFGKFVNQKAIDNCESFRITNDDKVIINITKQMYNEYNIQTFVLSPDPKEDTSPSHLNQKMYETKFYYGFVVTWPNGLVTESVFESNSQRISHIKQFYNLHVPSLEEEMRCISLNGEVIIFKIDGIIQVLRPDGSTITITKCRKKAIRVDNSPEESEQTYSKKKSSKEKMKDQKPNKSTKLTKNALSDTDNSEKKDLNYELFIDDFETIEPNGVRQRWIEEKSFFIEKILTRTATDYCLGETFSRRMDGTNTLLNKDGIQVVTFPDKTRIITKFVIEETEVFPEWTQEEIEYFELISNDSSEKLEHLSKSSCQNSTSTIFGGEDYCEHKLCDRKDGFISVQLIYIIEHINFTTVSINKLDNKISVDSPNQIGLNIDLDNCYEFNLNPVTTATFDGKKLNVIYEACLDCKSETTCSIEIDSIDNISEMRFNHQWLKMIDSFCKKIVVNGEGVITVIDEPSSEKLVKTDDEHKEDHNKYADKDIEKSSISLGGRGKCTDINRTSQLRFFVLRRDLTCSELIHKAIVENYKKVCRWQPWCSITQHDTFADHRILHSMLTPLHINESEKWLMTPNMAGKPTYLAYKDLNNLPGKGFYHWMRPYKRFNPEPVKSPSVLPPRTPRAFVLRTLEQQWREAKRDDFKGAKELVEALLAYRRIIENDSEMLLNVPIVDPRSDAERITDDLIQALGQKLYEDLKVKLEADMLSRVKADISTNPAPPPEDILLEEEDLISSYGEKMSEMTSSIKMAEEAEETSPHMKKYWRWRAEELKEEEFYLYLLRNPRIPPYFDNVLGGAIWWEINNAAGIAANKSERRHMRCHCHEENSSNNEYSDVPLA